MPKVELRDGLFIIDGKPTFLYGGTIQYYRTPKRLWEPAIVRLKEAKVNFIDIYIPWVWHEYEEGKWDFTGETIPERDLVGFLKLLRKHGMYLIARPGPNIYAEYINFGFPTWLIEKKELMQVTENGKTWHVVSFNHPLHLKYVERWYGMVWDVLKEFQDILIGTQVDNETGLLVADALISPTPLLRDFNPHTLKMFREWLQRKFGSVERMNECLGTNYASFSDFTPSIKLKWYKLFSDAENFGEFMVWQEFLEDWVVDYLLTLRGMMEKLGIPPPYLINEVTIPYPPCNPRKKSKVGPAGYDVYPKVLGGDHAFDMPFFGCYLSCMYDNYRWDGPIFSPETACGWFDPFSKVPLESTLQLVMMEIAHSTSFINYYILHDCIEVDGVKYAWDTCFDVEGNVKPRYEVVKKLGEFISGNEQELLRSREVKDDVAFVEYLPVHRSLGSDAFIQIFEFSSPAFFGLLHETGLNPSVIDLEMSKLEDLRKYKALFVLSKGHMDLENFEKLRRYVEDGGCLVVWPIAIYRDIYGRKLNGSEDLFPVELERKRRINFTLLYLEGMLSLIMWRVFRRWRVRSKWQLFTIDSTQQTQPTMIRFAQRSVRMRYPDGEVKCGPFYFSWKPVGECEIVMSRGKDIVGVRRKYGKGKVILIGAMPSFHLACGAYYKVKDKDREMDRKFAEWIIRECGISPNIRTTSNIEVVARKCDGNVLFFLLNRGDAKSGKFTVHNPEKVGIDPSRRYILEEVFSYHGSATAFGEVDGSKFLDGIECDLKKDDVLVVRARSA